MKPKDYLHSVIFLLSALLLLLCGGSVSASAADALSESARRIIPSLFPYMVLSYITVSLGLADPLCRFIPMRYFALPECSASVLLTGILCGFPTGASGSAVMFEDGRLSSDEAARLTALSSHVSPAFLTGVIGSLWGCPLFGWYLFLCGILYTVLTGVPSQVRKKKTVFSSGSPPPIRRQDFPSAFCRAVSSSASACVVVTGFIVFFRCLSAAISSFFPVLAPFCSILFEFSGGSVYSAGLGGIKGAALTGFAVGFSGFSVLAQLASYTSPLKLPFAPILASKFTEGTFTSAAAALFYLLYPMKAVPDSMSTGAISLSAFPVVLQFLLFFIRIAADSVYKHNKFFGRT